MADRKYIYHISDLHLGDEELEYEDVKVHLEPYDRIKNSDWFKVTLRQLTQDYRPDYVIVSGDFTIKNSEDGYKKFEELIGELQTTVDFPDNKRIFVVPGNHDVKWGLNPNDENQFREKYELFMKYIGDKFPRCWIPQYGDIELPKKSSDSWEGRSIPEGPIYNLPYIFDKDREIFICGFNSTRLCGVKQTVGQDVQKKLYKISKLNGFFRKFNMPIFSDLLTLVDELRLHDVAQIGGYQFIQIGECLDWMRKHGGDVYNRSVKIAVLHHHVCNLHLQQVEWKTFESVVDAALFKYFLIDNGFNIILHGHKHQFHVTNDTTVLRWPHPAGGIKVVASGTIGGCPRNSPSFNIISIDSDRKQIELANVKIEYSKIPDLDFVPLMDVETDKEEKIMIKKSQLTRLGQEFGENPALRPDILLENIITRRFLCKEASSKMVFRHEEPITNPYDFYGRESQMYQIYENISFSTPQNISLLGDIKMGKSSLLRIICHDEKRKKLYLKDNIDRYEFVYVNLSKKNPKNPDKFFKIICDKLTGRDCDVVFGDKLEYRELFQRIVGGLNHNGKTVILAFDDFECIIGKKDFEEDFFSFLGSISKTKKVSYLTSSREELYQLAKKKTSVVSPFFNTFKPIYLGSLERQEAINLIEKPSDCILHEYVDYIFELAGYHPFFIRIACSICLDCMPRLSQDEIVAILPRRFDNKVEGYFDAILKFLSFDEKSLLLRIAEEKDGITIKAISTGSVNNLCVLGEEEIIYNLCDKGYVIKGKDGKYRIFSSSVIFRNKLQLSVR